jgi:homoserine dehydrogenase
MTTVAALDPGPVVTISEWRQKQSSVRVALLGLGQVGSAVVRLAKNPPADFDVPVQIRGALVRRTQRAAAPPVPVTTDPSCLFDPPPDVLIAVLGGVEPARPLVRDALRRGIPVVTANKSLLASHGDELLETSRRSGVPLHYEATVLAGVPFLGTFARRPYAAAVTRVLGIVNGTSNFVLSQVALGADLAGAISLAQSRGFTEPDPTKDLSGIDAVEKLTVLIRHFGHLTVIPESSDLRQPTCNRRASLARPSSPSHLPTGAPESRSHTSGRRLSH